MQTFNTHKARTHLSRLVERAAGGESFIIAKAGKPMVKVVALEEPEAKSIQRLGFMKGRFTVPKDFDSTMSGEIVRLFEEANEPAA